MATIPLYIYHYLFVHPLMNIWAVSSNFSFCPQQSITDICQANNYRWTYSFLQKYFKENPDDTSFRLSSYFGIPFKSENTFLSIYYAIITQFLMIKNTDLLVLFVT